MSNRDSAPQLTYITPASLQLLECRPNYGSKLICVRSPIW